MRPYRELDALTLPPSSPAPGGRGGLTGAGGLVSLVDDWTRLDRFLVLGSEGGTYRASERALTRDNAEAALRCIRDDGPRAVARIARMSRAGRAPKCDPALLALAMALGLGDATTKAAAGAALPEVCRTATHLFHLAAYAEQFRGWGRALRGAVRRWYAQPAESLAYQLVKYQRRDGWSHRDLLRLAHPRPPTDAHAILYHWATRGWGWVGDEPHPVPSARIVWAFERAKRATSREEIVRLIRDEGLPRECVPNRWLGDAAVWEALLDGMPIRARIRNLATMTRVGLLTPGSGATERIAGALGDAERLRRARVHPLDVLIAQTTYARGHGIRGGGTWSPVPRVRDALDAAFYASFGTVQPAGKRTLLALDVSGSMSAGAVAGVRGLTPRVASAAMAMVTASTEPDHEILAFSHRLVPAPVAPGDPLESVVASVEAMEAGGTDCALPMLWAIEQRVPVDTFVVYTDGEAGHGDTHPAQALRRYREATGIAARLVVVGLVSNGFTFADPDDAGMLDVVGFDSAAPALINDFSAGRLGDDGATAPEEAE